MYFEVSRYDQLSAESEYQRHKAYLPKQFDSFEITGLEEALCASLPARAYTFSWPQGKRTVLLVEREDAIYRLLYNPIPVVNRAILSNVEWLNLP